MTTLRIVRCTHPHCRTTLTEDDVTYCPHDLAFCEGCTWEDACEGCDDLALDRAMEAAVVAERDARWSA